MEEGSGGHRVEARAVDVHACRSEQSTQCKPQSFSRTLFLYLAGFPSRLTRPPCAHEPRGQDPGPGPKHPLSTTAMSSPTPSSAPSAQSPSTTSSAASAPTSLTDDLDRLTTAIQQVGDEIATCKQESEERHNARLARDEQETQRTLSVQEQLAQMIAMTQESLRRRREEPVVGECFRTRSSMFKLGWGVGFGAQRRMLDGGCVWGMADVVVAVAVGIEKSRAGRRSTRRICRGLRSGRAGTRRARRGRPCWSRGIQVRCYDHTCILRLAISGKLTIFQYEVQQCLSRTDCVVRSASVVLGCATSTRDCDGNRFGQNSCIVWARNALYGCTRTRAVCGPLDLVPLSMHISTPTSQERHRVFRSQR